MSICEEFAPSEDTNPISSLQKYKLHENECTSELSLASIQNNVASRNNIKSNPFAANSLTAEITDFSNFNNGSNPVLPTQKNVNLYHLFNFKVLFIGSDYFKRHCLSLSRSQYSRTIIESS
jgi:hypothetical protein